VDLGFERMVLKDETLRCYFINKPDSPYFESETFQQVLKFIQTQTNKAKLKQTGKNFILIIEDIESMEQLQQFLVKMHRSVRKAEVVTG
jgi:transcription-repair coupling factor (superfamily II helicase)